jgi:hypothetical protein
MLMAMLAAAALSAQAPADKAPAAADASARQTEAQAQRAAERLAALQHEADALTTQERTLLAELRKLEVDRAIKVEQLGQIERQAAGVQAQLAAHTSRTEALKGEADRQRPDVDARLVQIYKLGRAGYWRLLLDVKSLREVGRAYRTAAALGRIDRDRVEEHRRTMAALATERSALQARAKELEGLKRKARDTSAAVERAVAARSDLVASIDSRRDLNAQLTGELQDAQRKLQATLTDRRGTSGGGTALPSVPSRGPCHGRPPTACCRPASACGPWASPVRRSATASKSLYQKDISSTRSTKGRSPSPTSSAATGRSSSSITGTTPIPSTATSAAPPSIKVTMWTPRPPSDWPAATRPATRPSTLSCASTASPWIPYNG